MRDVHAAMRDVVDAHEQMHTVARDAALANIAERAAAQAKTDAEAGE